MSETPITDRLEAAIEADGKRDVPVRLYQEMRRLETERNELAKALESFASMRVSSTPKGYSSTVFLEKVGAAKRLLSSLTA